MRGRVVHFEVPFEDRERATAFYRDVFEWEMSPLPEMDYTVVNTGPTGDVGPDERGFINGGMLQRQLPVGSPVLVMDVEDIDAALERVDEHGGTVVTAKQAVGEMGWSAYFQDPEGNVLGLWQSAVE